MTRRPRTSETLCLLALGVLALCVAACADRDAVRVLLHAQPSPDGDGRRLEIRAEVTGPQAGLRYKWFSVSGECQPQEGDRPSTVFEFADGTTRDRVSLEVWRDDERVATRELDVTLDEPRVRAASRRQPKVQIAIIKIPPYEPEGGPDTRADIAGTVSGEVSPDLRVVIYARADAWYSQPTPYALHAIGSGNTWSSWTHTGSSYAALVVWRTYTPFARLDVLPQVGGDVLARTIVEGRSR